MSNEKALEGFLSKVEELTQHIEQNKQLLVQKKEELQRQLQAVATLEEEWKQKELEYTKILYHNAHVSYRVKQLEQQLKCLNHTIELNKKIYEDHSQKIKSLEEKKKNYMSLLDNEKTKWQDHIERTVRNTADLSKTDFQRNKKSIQTKQHVVDQIQQSIRKLEEDLEVFALEKVVQQDEYNTQLVEWKRKQERIMELNQTLLSLNQEFNELRQKHVQRQKEENLQRDRSYRMELARMGKQPFSSRREFVTAAEQLRSIQEEWK